MVLRIFSAHNIGNPETRGFTLVAFARVNARISRVYTHEYHEKKTHAFLGYYAQNQWRRGSHVFGGPSASFFRQTNFLRHK